MKLSGVPEPTVHFPPAALEVHNLTKTFPVGKSGRFITAVNNVNFSIQKGEVLGLVGESGSGKSTIARLITRLQEPSGS